MLHNHGMNLNRDGFPAGPQVNLMQRALSNGPVGYTHKGATYGHGAPMPPEVREAHAKEIYALFGEPNEKNLTDPHDLIPRSTKVMHEAWLGPNKHIAEVIISTLTSELEWFLRVFMPIHRFSGSPSFQITRYVFNDTMVDNQPELSAPRVTTQQSSSQMFDIARRGKGIYMEHGFMLTDKGKSDFLNHCRQIEMGLYFRMIYEILLQCQAIRDDVPLMIDSVYTGTTEQRTRRRIIEEEIRQTGCLNRDKNAIHHLSLLARNILASNGQGIKCDCMIVPVGVSSLYALNHTEAHEWGQAGPNGQRALVYPREWFSSQAPGISIVESMHIAVGHSSLQEDVLRHARLFGEFTAMSCRHLNNFADYQSELRDVRVQDYERDRIGVYNFVHALACSGLWDKRGNLTPGLGLPYFTNMGTYNNVKEWVEPYARRMGVSADVYAQKLFGLDDHSGLSQEEKEAIIETFGNRRNNIAFTAASHVAFKGHVQKTFLAANEGKIDALTEFLKKVENADANDTYKEIFAKSHCLDQLIPNMFKIWTLTKFEGNGDKDAFMAALRDFENASSALAVWWNEASMEDRDTFMKGRKPQGIRDDVINSYIATMKLFAELNSEPADPLDFKTVPIHFLTLDVFRKAFARNAPLPVEFLVCRQISVDCGNVIIAEKGANMGQTYIGNENVMLSERTDIKAMLGHFTVNAQPHIDDKKRVDCLRNVCFMGYNFGGGTRFYNANNPQHRAEINSLDGPPADAHLIPVFPDEDIVHADYFDLTGVLPPMGITSGHREENTQFRMAVPFCNFWDITGHPMEYFDRKNINSERGEGFKGSTFMARETAIYPTLDGGDIKLHGFIDPGMGRFGRSIYAGKRSDLSGFIKDHTSDMPTLPTYSAF